MEWYKNAIFYELYPRAFADNSGDGHGDLAGMRKKLEYLQWLGVDCIWLTPIYPSPLLDDGYDISSFYSVAPKFGMMEDFKMAIEEIHQRGMKVIIDLVVNHTSDQHPWFLDAKSSKDSPYRDYYVWTDNPNKYSETRIIFKDTEESNWAYDEASGEYYWHRFYSSQPDLNFDNPKVVQELLDIMDFWLQFGIDGFRVDAVPYLIEREGTNCENLPETHDILKKMRRFVDENYPKAILLAEANQWPNDLLPYFGTPEEPEFHMCFHFPVMPRLYMALARGDRQDIIDIMNDTPPIPEGNQWATFLRNHDELTLEMVSLEDREFMWDYYAPQPRMRLNLGIRRRLAPLMENDRRKIELMHSMLMTLPGAPVLYYGDAMGMGDNIQLNDRNGVRTPMQWSDEENGGFSSNASTYEPIINDPEYGYKTVNIKVQREDESSLLHAVRKLILTRKGLPVLARGSVEWLMDTPSNTLCFWRKQSDQPSILALHNLSAFEVTVDLPEGVQFISQLDEQAVSKQITLAPYGFSWLQAQ